MQPGPHLDYGHARVGNHGYQSTNMGIGLADRGNLNLHDFRGSV
jgi:hypothetical protein